MKKEGIEKQIKAVDYNLKQIENKGIDEIWGNHKDLIVETVIRKLKEDKEYWEKKLEEFE